MTELPTGTVTFLFTDIEGSTARWEHHPEAMQVALVRHDKIIESAIDAHGGVVVSRMGDGVAAAFASARNALAAAVVAQEDLDETTWPEPVVSLRVRMGVHTGEGTVLEGSYLSTPLNRCARLMAIGHGGQILVSGATEPLVKDALPEDVRLLDLGEHRLRDLSEPLRVFQVEHHAVKERFPPLASLDALPGNLPRQASSFLGREREVARVTRALAEGRIVTLTGVGGVGKTRLALQVAAEVLPRFREGAWLIELAPVRDPAEVIGAFAAVFKVSPRSGLSLQASLEEFLRTKQALLVIDNCEHLLEELGDLIEALERACGGLVFLATSREGIGLEGEQNLTVPSMATPAPEADLEEIGRSEAVSLFVERARRVDAEFVLDAHNADSVLKVCRRLDGVPLAIELAAAQVAAMTPVELAAGLDHRFETLAGGRRRAVQRHQTLRATIDWSYDLLTEPERQLLDRLAVFAGGCTREGAQAVCSGPPVEERELFRLLRGLVAKSLVVAERADHTSRYRLLETIREYGEERLAQRGETRQLRDRHAAHYSSFVGQLSNEVYGPEEIKADGALMAEKDNVVTAMNHAIDTGQLDLALSLLATTPGVQNRVGIWMLVESILSLPDVADHPRYPLALAVGASMAGVQGDYETAQARCHQAEDAIARLGDPAHLAEHEINTAQTVIAAARGDLEKAAAHMQRNVEVERSAGRLGAAALIQGVVASLHARAGDTDTAIALAGEGLALARQVGMPTAMVGTLTALAGALMDRDRGRAEALWREMITVWRTPGYEIRQWTLAQRAVFVGTVLADWTTVLELASRTIRLIPVTEEWIGVAEFMDTVARALAPYSPEAAATLQGTARRGDPAKEIDAEDVPDLSAGSFSREAALRHETTEILTAALGETRLRDLQAQGRTMNHDQAMAFALGAIVKAQALVGP